MSEEHKIAEQVKLTIDAADKIEQVKASPFLKNKVMRRLFDEPQEQIQLLFPWFTPRLQLTTLAVLILMNIIAFRTMSLSSSSEDIDRFAQAYELIQDNDVTLFE